MSSTSPNLPETPDEISLELRKQESLLSQIHSEMNAGFVTKKREEELWETQRIITQLKVSLIMQVLVVSSNESIFCLFQRKLRSFEKRHDSMQKSLDTEAVEEAIDFTLQTTETSTETVVQPEPKTTQEAPEVINTAITQPQEVVDLDKVYVTDNGFLMLHPEHPEYLNLIRLQLENQELINWKQQLQARINAERAECVRLKRLAGSAEVTQEVTPSINPDDPEYERIVDHYMKENALLEQKRSLLAKEILDENISLIQLEVDLAMMQFLH